MGKFVVLPTPLGEGIFKTFYIWVAGLSGRDLMLGYDPTKSLPYAELDVKDLTKQAIRLFKQEFDFMMELVGVPIVRGRAPGTDGFVLFKAGVSLPSGRGKDFRRKVIENMIELMSKGDLSEELSLDNCSIDVGRGKSLTIRVGSGNVKLPSIVRTEVFYETGRFGLLRDLGKGRPSLGLVSIEGSVATFAVTLLTVMLCEVALEENNRLLCTIDVNLGASLPSVAIRSLLISIKRIIRWLRRSGVGTYAEDFDLIRLAILFELYSLVGEKLTWPEFQATQIKCHLISSTGRRFLKTLEFTIPLQQVFVLDKSLEIMLEEPGRRTVFANSLAHTLIGVARLDKLQARMKITMPVITRMRTAIKNVSYAVLEGNVKVALDHLYIISRFLREEDFTSSLVSGIAASIRGEAEASDVSLTVEDVRKKVGTVMRDLRELCQIAV